MIHLTQAQPVAKARALYEYTRQTDEELSFPEDAVLVVYDTSDQDWILVGLKKEYGFVPSNYIDMQDDVDDTPISPAAAPGPPTLPSRAPVTSTDSDNYSDPMASPSPPASPAANNPAAALAGVLAGRAVPPPPQAASTPPMSPRSPQTHDYDEEEVRSPQLPARPQPQTSAPSRSESRRVQFPTHVEEEDTSGPIKVPGGFHMYNINEMVSVMGKRKKMPTTLGINLGTGTILIAPEKASDGPTQEWTGEKMTHYSREGKHVFMELVRPSKSIDFHAGAKDTAEEIVSALGELAGAVKAAGLREVIFAGSGQSQKKGTVLYDFMAQGDDEVTVAQGDDVVIIDDIKSEEWWQVRRVKNGKEGVVPSEYIEVTGTVSPPAASSGVNAGLSTVEQNRLEEIRLTKEAMKAAHNEPQQQVGPGMPLPARASSLQARDNGNNSGQRKRESGRGDGSTRSKPSGYLVIIFSDSDADPVVGPDSAKVRTWTDRSKSFSVEAQFLGLKDGKINLHKMNGVKIAVPVAKMSLEDLEYVEQLTGVSLDEDKPLSDVKRNATRKAAESRSGGSSSANQVGASIEPQQPKQPEYDWFQFFLECEVPLGVCERYAQAFNKESMTESVLPDVDATVLRNLGLREGDILKVMRYLDQRFARNKKSKDDEEGGGLFSGPGGALRNNTRKGRPAPAVQTSDVVDPKAFGVKDDKPSPATPPAASPKEAPAQQTAGAGFDDDAWDVKPSKKAEEPQSAKSEPTPAPAPVQTPALTGAMQELSLLSKPLEPSRTASQPAPPPPPAPAPVLSQPPPAQNPQPTGATPAFFAANNLAAQQRQRPMPPQSSGGQGALPPPPGRPLSAPLSAQPSNFAPPPLAPQMTGALQGRVAPPGQSLDEVSQMRLQQQMLQQQQQQLQQLQQQQQQFPQIAPQMTGFPGQQPLQQFQTGIPQQAGPGPFMQPMMTGMAPQQSPFGDPRPQQFSPMQVQPTGFGQFPQQQQPFNPQATGVNAYLPPALQPQPTGFNNPTSPPPMQPLVPQKTGPPPPVRFGVTGDVKKLAPQATGRRANLAQASKSTCLVSYIEMENVANMSQPRTILSVFKWWSRRCMASFVSAMHCTVDVGSHDM